MKHISVGDVLRRVSKEPTELGAQLRFSLREGNLTPDRITINILKEELLRDNIEQRERYPIVGYLMDGFPRTVEQAIMFEQEIGVPRAVFALSVSEEIMKNRILQRSHQNSHRSDDTLDCIEKV